MQNDIQEGFYIKLKEDKAGFQNSKFLGQSLIIMNHHWVHDDKIIFDALFEHVEVWIDEHILIPWPEDSDKQCLITLNICGIYP